MATLFVKHPNHPHRKAQIEVSAKLDGSVKVYKTLEFTHIKHAMSPADAEKYASMLMVAAAQARKNRPG